MFTSRAEYRLLTRGQC
ncbi:MAG: hypothetical protein HS130_02645 [Deltaproteobacteria bacterium]|nr:hypothetical protein [Deltaproteobacteria bacterium]